jgi:hypothetical protein
MNAIFPARDRNKALVKAEQKLADHDAKITATQSAIRDHCGAQREALFASGAGEDEIAAHDARLPVLEVRLEKLERDRAPLLAEVNRQTEEHRRQLRGVLLDAHHAACVRHVAAHRAAAQTAFAVIQARDALVAQGFRADADALPLLPLHLMDMGNPRAPLGVAVHPALDAFEREEAKAHRALSGGA